jgi:tRNA pseudouridine38-40 synthase
MRTYKLTIAYDGTNYQGWQRQANTDRTIQGILEGALTQCTGYEVQADGSGRTDAGVHALGQTVSIVLSGKVQTDLFVRKLNDFLPPDIRILNAELVKNGFHARKSATGKVYEYRIDTGMKPDVFTRRYCYHFPRELDLASMKKAAGYLTGMHSFAAYTDKKDGKSVRRTVYGITITEEKGKIQGNGQNRIGMGDYVVIRYDGTGFLYHMVRILTGTLLEVGVGERTAESVKEALDSNDRAKAGFLAPARGLFLKEVRYE